MKHDLANTLNFDFHFQGAYTTTQTPSNGVDLQGKINPTFIVSVGAMSAVSPNDEWEFTLEESDAQSSGFTAVAGADMVTDPDCIQPGSVASGKFVEVTPDNDNAVYRVTYKGVKRYARVVATAVNAPASTPIAVLVASQPAIAPAAG